MYNLQTRSVQFTNQEKSEKVQTVRIKLSKVILQGLKYKLMIKLLDILKIYYIIQRLNLLTNKMAENVPLKQTK